MKKIKFVVIALLLAVLVLIVLNYKKEDYATYKNEEWNYQINYPADWSMQTLQDNENGAIMRFMSPQAGNEDKFAENVSVISTTKPASEDFDKAAERSINALEEDENKNLIEYSKVELTGLPSYKIIYTEILSNGEFQYLQYWLEGKENKVYMVMFTAETDKYSEYLKQAENIIKTFKIL